MRLLIVEDNLKLSAWLAKLLRAERYIVDCVNDGDDGAHALQTQPYDVAIIDLGLPKMGGIDLIRATRDRGVTVPILILTANDSLSHRVKGLDAGADDYLSKPFEISELEARLRALSRRTATSKRAQLSFGPLVLDQNTRLFELAGKQLHLSPREYALLETLFRKAGTTVSKAWLMESIFGFEDEPSDSAIELYVHRLRKKLEGSTVSIATLRGLGYLLRTLEN
ncbi:response regulator [Devosia sp.]|uniref:response regulator n=1 Tax=Devosia sp. TaxID=1871048 RepID=UPI0032636933